MNDEQQQFLNKLDKQLRDADDRLRSAVITPGRYVGAAAQEADAEPLEKKWPA